jgi:mRNA interferase MazF
MPSTTVSSFGDVVLVPFPFTNQTGQKKRPAVVVSSRAYGRVKPDLILMAVTSQLRPMSLGEVEVTAWEAAGLLKPSVIKPVFTTVERHLVVRLPHPSRRRHRDPSDGNGAAVMPAPFRVGGPGQR